jgi:hypothetical protein
MARALIIARVGVRSIHNAWIERGAARDFDLYVSPHEPVPFQSEPQAGIEVGPVYPEIKWRALHRLLNEWQGWRTYDFVTFVDDDVLMDQKTWNTFFNVVRRRNAALAQPALTHDSFWSHILTLRNANFLWRETTFVEAMAPCFRVDVLERLLPTFALSVSGWGYGLEFVWAKRLDYKDIIVVDATTMRHTRPVGGNYPPGLMDSLCREMRALMQAENVPWLLVTLAGQTRDKGLLPRTSATFLRLYLEGYWDMAKGDDKFFSGLLQAQTGARFGS